jgi:hypothetical protein
MPCPRCRWVGNVRRTPAQMHLCVGASTDVSMFQCIPRSFCLIFVEETSSPSQFRSLIFVASIDRYQSFPERPGPVLHSPIPALLAALTMPLRERVVVSMPRKVPNFPALCSQLLHSFCIASAGSVIPCTPGTGAMRRKIAAGMSPSRWILPNPPNPVYTSSSVTWIKLRPTGKKHTVGWTHK